MDSSKIIVFNQFDVWKAWDNSFNISNHHELTMYYIKVNCLFNSIYLNPTHILFNKRYNLITGQILKKLPERVMKKIDILYYKEPSFIHKVDYKGIVDELWNTTIDEMIRMRISILKNSLVMLITDYWRRGAQQATKA